MPVILYEGDGLNILKLQPNKYLTQIGVDLMRVFELGGEFSQRRGVSEDENVRPGRSDMPVLAEYTDVKLTAPYKRPGLALPRGAVGTIVQVYPKLHAYTVEFAAPYSCVETVSMDVVVPIGHG
jgi:hypothetical protein